MEDLNAGSLLNFDRRRSSNILRKSLRSEHGGYSIWPSNRRNTDIFMVTPVLSDDQRSRRASRIPKLPSTSEKEVDTN